MPSIYTMNPPPNPFWDFVSGIEDHPIFTAYGRPHHAAFRGRFAGRPFEQPANPQTTQPATEHVSEKARGKQPSVEDEDVQDPPEVDPSTAKTPNNDAETPEGFRGMPFRGRGRFARAFEGGAEEPRRGGCRGRGGHRGWPGLRLPHEQPWAHRGPPPPPGPHEHQHGPHHGPSSPPRHHEHHAGHPHGPHHGPPSAGHDEHHHGPPHGPHHGPHARRPHHPGREGFNLPDFLNNLGSRLGVDLSAAAEGFGLDRFNGTRNNADTDFEPHTDIFDTENNYIIHLSLPGAKKEDVGVDWDGEHSSLRIAGVVHRPGVDEELMAKLAVDGRKRDTGVFDKSIRLGTKRDPANIDISAISAKMNDGVLVVKVPKLEITHKNREVPISSSSTPSPVRDAAQYELQNEKQLLWDGDSEMSDTTVEAVPHEPPVNGTKDEEKQAVNETEAEHDKTAEVEPQASGPALNQLPTYEAGESHESDWEKYSDDEEGEFVKINVD